MTVNELLTLMTQGIVLLVALLTLVGYARHRDQTRLDVLLMLGDLAVIVVMQLIIATVAGASRWLGWLVSILLLAHPYLLLRLVEHFRLVPRWLRWFALGGLIVSWLVLIVLSPNVPPPIIVAIVAYFVALESYAAFAFIRGAQSASGVTHRRMLLAAFGSIAFAGVILLAGISVALPVDRSVIAVLSRIFSVLAGLSYYFGFTPPLWLRRSWQLDELHSFLNQALANPAGEQTEESLQRLCSAAVRAMGGWPPRRPPWTRMRHVWSSAPPPIHSLSASTRWEMASFGRLGGAGRRPPLTNAGSETRDPKRADGRGCSR